ncbi:hypothetical protein [Actinoplanes sp. NPDC049802]|uniref:hypothetical protein n=1 Tax=Actinoplanes sp. NPDC049802 TaxID=3154742 RepID=UPI00340957C5
MEQAIRRAGISLGDLDDHGTMPARRVTGDVLRVAQSLVAVLLLMLALGAPREVLALLTAGGTGPDVFALVTHWWKMSIHAGTVAALTAVHGPVTLLGVPLVMLGCWARVRLTAHTPAQVVAGALAGTIFPALR